MDRPTILVVEDEVLVRLVVSDALRAGGFLVLEAANAAEAVAILESRGGIALLFTDIQMPGPMDGVGLVRLARARFPDMAIVVTSGHMFAVQHRDHVADFVSKPYLPEDVVRRIRDVINRSEE